MKKWVLLFVMGAIIGITGCGSEQATTSQPTEESEKETSNPDEQWSPWTFNDISFDMPDSWEYGKDNSTEKTCYFYPDDGMFMINITDETDITEETLEGFIEGLEDTDGFVVTKSEIYNFRGNPSFHVFTDYNNDDGLQKGEWIVTNINGYQYGFLISSIEEGKYKDEFYKILNSVSEIQEEEPEAEITEEVEEETEATEPEATIGEQNALDKALSYLEFSAFSKEGLRGQLEYEGFKKSEIDYAIKNCGANWKEQAVKKAKEYLEYQSFSKKGLYDQLIYEKFTEEQAQYGVDQAYK